MAGVMAAGINGGYHDGGFQWAHELISRVQHNSAAVLALATGRADQFLTEAALITAGHEKSPCPFATVVARVQAKVVPAQARFAEAEAMSDVMSAREQVALARVEASRARAEARIASRMARVRFEPAVFNPVEFKDFKVQTACPRVHIAIPKINVPKINIPAPVVDRDESDPI